MGEGKGKRKQASQHACDSEISLGSKAHLKVQSINTILWPKSRGDGKQPEKQGKQHLIRIGVERKKEKQAEENRAAAYATRT